MTGQTQPSQKFVDEITKLLEAKDFSSALDLFTDQEHEDLLKTSSWDLIPVLCKHITNEARSKNEELAQCCETLLEKLAAVANPEEAVLEFLDQMDEADSEKFTVVLKLLKIIFSQEMPNRVKSLEWTLNSIRSYTEQYSCSETSDYMSSKDENFYNPEKISEIEIMVNSIIQFYEPFVIEVKENTNADELKCLISSRLIQMFDIFFPYIKIGLHPQLKLIQWKIIDLILQLISNPMTLLQYVFFRALNVMKSNLKQSSETEKKIDISTLDEKNLNLTTSIVNLSPYEDETIVSNLAYGMFFYSLLSETDNEQIKVPMVYNPKYIMLSLIYVTVSFFDKTDTAINNGLNFLNLLLTRLNDNLTKADLYFSTHKNLLIGLNHIMIYSELEENRKLAMGCFKKYIESFDWEAKYLLLLNLRPHVQHSGTLGFLISLIKEFVSNFLELTEGSQEFRKFLKYYKGKLLFDIIKKYCFLTNGVNTDLVENADHVIASLNALRYLVLRDKKNVTDVKNFIKKIHSDFLRPLKENINTSKHFYNLKLKDLESSNSKESVTSSGSDINIELAVKGQALPKLTKEQQKTAFFSCMNAVDLIDSLHNRLLECIIETYGFIL